MFKFSRRNVSLDSCLQVCKFGFSQLRQTATIPLGSSISMPLFNIPILGRLEERAKYSAMQICLPRSRQWWLYSREHRRYHPYRCACFSDAWQTMAQLTLYSFILTSDSRGLGSQRLSYQGMNLDVTLIRTHPFLLHTQSHTQSLLVTNLVHVHLWFTVSISVLIDSSPIK